MQWISELIRLYGVDADCSPDFLISLCRGQKKRFLGLAIALGCNVCPIFKQIGIWDEFLENSKPVLDMNISNSQRETILKHDFRSQGEMYV